MHLKKTADFTAVHSHGKWNGSQLLGIKSRPNNLDYTRCGIIASKKVGGAVVRNRAKRRLREIVRNFNIKPGYDIILISRAGIEQAAFAEISGVVKRLLVSQKLLENTNETHRVIDD